MSAGDRTDFSAVAAHAEDETGTQALLTSNTWDGMRRYTRARQLYVFPLAAIVGLTADEQLAATRQTVDIGAPAAAVTHAIGLKKLAVKSALSSLE